MLTIEIKDCIKWNLGSKISYCKENTNFFFFFFNKHNIHRIRFHFSTGEKNKQTHIKPQPTLDYSPQLLPFSYNFIRRQSAPACKCSQKIFKAAVIHEVLLNLIIPCYLYFFLHCTMLHRQIC